MFFRSVPQHKLHLPSAAEALPGRAEPIATSSTHAVLNTPLKPPFPDDMQQIIVGMGCFWGAERLFWQLDGVYTTAVGYIAGMTPNPTYEEVCSGLTGHNEAVLIVFDPSKLALNELLRVFWENHDPTQGMRQGNDQGTQYRSGIYTNDLHQRAQVEVSKAHFADALQAADMGPITTEIAQATEFYYAEHHHQQYLHKNPGGYCGLAGTGICMKK